MHAIHHSFANLMQALLEMRDALKLESYTFIELSVNAAMIDIRKKTDDENITIDALRAHPLLSTTPKPSLYRAIKTLQGKGRCRHTGTARSGIYRLSS